MLGTKQTVNTILDGVRVVGVEMIRIRVRERKAKQIVQEYARRKPAAVRLVDKLITAAGKSMNAFMADALAEKLGDIGRIDRLTTIAESRRNASLREIDRHRAVLGETLRRSVQEIEDGKFEVIEATPAKRENAAWRATARSRPTARMRGPAPARNPRRAHSHGSKRASSWVELAHLH